MYRFLLLPSLALVMGGLLATANPNAVSDQKVLFDFEEPADLKAWSSLELPDAKQKEPPAKLELSTNHVTSGKQSLKITFDGGRWPTLTTTRIPDDWSAWETFQADVTVGRPCVVGFTVLQEQSKRGIGYDENVSRWTKTAFLKSGKNLVTAPLRPSVGDQLNPKRGKVIRLEIFMYCPQVGESIHVDNLRLTTQKTERPPAKVRFTVAGTNWELVGVNTTGVSSAGAVIELGKKLKDRWTMPESRSVAQIEQEFADCYTKLKKQHPRAVLAVLRDGEKGYDPTQPDKVYAGWKDAHVDSHGPDSAYVTRATNHGRAAAHEVFMRHRSRLLRVDLSSIPVGAAILAAQLVVVRANDASNDKVLKNPTMWVVEPCNRPWEEDEVNAFEYAKDKFWTTAGGFHWGEDPDFLPIFLAYGPGQPRVNAWDFAVAVRFWTSSKNPNHGAMLHGDAQDYMIAHTRKATEIKNRPAVLVIYDPK